MSENNKLNQSLDDILKGRKASAGRRRPNARRAAGGKPAAAAPVGGVKKATKAPKAAAKTTIPTGPALKTHGESKILVSGLPQDVSEPQIKEYFGKSVGPVKKVLLTYGPNGQSRGVATVIFSKPEAAAQAANTHNGLKVDNRPIRVEVILGASDIAPIAAPKTLTDRISQPKQVAKAQPKAATAPKPATEKKKREKKPRAKAAGRVKKTAEELDAEMADYFVGGSAPADGDTAMNGGAVQQTANGGDTGMDDEVMPGAQIDD
ncbi:hypothetical protein K490DRAFT_64222 [Saccharata proteae CBS 121410]|uniref:RRM domain-containing protein n=1 Tax=Saccharata proteae CBS 121410 TaxID=1314787 RepID=A0A6A5YDW8_9PEZI|nr:hypothetical protein K490DRAFT_64222 [Saccharata proteae CBS 121410]